jgi:hypothetical protein
MGKKYSVNYLTKTMFSATKKVNFKDLIASHDHTPMTRHRDCSSPVLITSAENVSSNSSRVGYLPTIGTSPLGYTTSR